MDVQATLTRLSASGVTLAADNGQLTVESRQPLSDAQRAWLAAHKAELIEALRPRRLWLITDADGNRWSSSFTPPATLAEVQARYPGATIEPEPEPPAPAGSLAPDDDAVIRRWLAHIGEVDPVTIRQVLEKAAADPAALAYFKGRAEEAGTSG